MNLPSGHNLSRRLVFVVGTLVLAVGASGCVTPSTPQATKTVDTKPVLTADQAAIAPYVKEADAICETARTKMAANLAAFEVHKSVTGSAKRKTVKLAKPSEVASYINGQFVHLEEQQKAIRTLDLPAGDGGTKIDGLFTEAEKIMTTVEQDPEAAAYNDPFHDVAKSMKQLGFKQCFQGSRPKGTDESS